MSVALQQRLVSQPRVVSVRDLDYQVIPQISYHPAFSYAASERLVKQFPNLAEEIRYAFEFNAMKNAWGIVIENNGAPLFVAQNVSRVVNSPVFRRVLRIQLNGNHNYQD